MIVNSYSDHSIATYLKRGGDQKKNQRMDILHNLMILETQECCKDLGPTNQAFA